MGSVLATLLTPKGRMNRAEFATVFCLGFGILVALFAVVSLVEPQSRTWVDGTLGLFIAAFVLWKYIAIVGLVKRLHDMDTSGLFWLLLFVPFVGLLLYLVALFAPGSEKDNRYGSPSQFFEPRVLPEKTA